MLLHTYTHTHTTDKDHVGPAKAFAQLGYHILLEKPIGTTREEVLQIKAAIPPTIVFSTGHVLRSLAHTHTHTRTLMRV
jgi:predicted dehydrogenase